MKQKELDKEYLENICDMSKIYEAYRKCHRGKSNSRDVIEFDKEAMKNLYNIQKHLLNKEWSELLRYYRFVINKPKKRIVDAMTFEGRIVQHLICDNILEPYFEKRLIYTNSACRKNKGTDFALNYTKQSLTKFFKKHNAGYVLKMDIHQYFASINKDILKQSLKEFPEGDIKDLIFFIINNTPKDSTGIPIGNQTSQWFALYYLDKLDRRIKEKWRVNYYVRYMDDFIIISEDKKFLQQILKDLDEFLRTELRLELNPKTTILPIKRGFNFLGWRFKITLSHKILKTIPHDKQKDKKYTIYTAIKKYLCKVISKNDFRDKIISMINFLAKGQTNQFRKLILQRCERYCII